MLKKRAKAEEWCNLREKAEHESTTKATQKTADAAAANAVKLEKARGLAIDWLTRVLEKATREENSSTRQAWVDEKGRQNVAEIDLADVINALSKLGCEVYRGSGAADDRPVIVDVRPEEGSDQ